MSPHNCTVNFAVHEKNQSSTSVNINNFKVAKEIQDFGFLVIMICHKQVLPEEIVFQACFFMSMYRVAGKRHPLTVSDANCKSGNRSLLLTWGCLRVIIWKMGETRTPVTMWLLLSPSKSGRDAERSSQVKPAPLHKKKSVEWQQSIHSS